LLWQSFGVVVSVLDDADVTSCPSDLLRSRKKLRSSARAQTTSVRRPVTRTNGVTG